MIQLLFCFLILIIHVCLFALWGDSINSMLVLKKKGMQTILVGFFVYFAALQLIYLPLLIFKAPFIVLVIAWVIINLALIIKYIITKNTGIRQVFAKLTTDMKPRNKVIMGVSLAILVMAMIYQSCRYYAGFDTSYYVGTISTTLYTNKMYVYNGETGLMENSINMRYALSCFYMNSAIWCKLFGVAPIIFQKHLMGNLCIIFFYMISYLMGKKLFENNSDKAYAFAGVLLVIGACFMTTYSNMDFLFYRGYEAKGYCANVIIPALFYAALYIMEEPDSYRGWSMLFIFSLASVPVSMSAMMIVPVIVGIVALSESIIRRKLRYVLRGVVCVIPNVVYMLIYFLFSTEICMIKI